MFTKNIKISGLIGYLNILVTITVGILITPYLIRHLGSSEYGLYSLVAGMIMLMAVFDFGLTGTVSRFVAKYRVENDNASLLEAINTVQFIFCILYVLIIFSVSLYIFIYKDASILSLSRLESSKALVLLAILLPSVPSVMQTAIYYAICNGYESFIFPKLAVLGKYILKTGLMVVAIMRGYDAIALVLIELFLAVCIHLISAYYVKYRFSIVTRLALPSLSTLKVLGEYSMWMFVWAVAMHFFWKFGQLSVASAIGAEAVTLYALCIMLGTYYGSFVGAYATLFLPAATRLVHKESEEDIFRASVNIGYVNGGVLLFILGGFVSVGKVFVILWLGDEIDVDVVWLGALMIMLGYTIPLTQSFFNHLLEARGLVKIKAVICIVFLPISTYLGAHFMSGFGVLGIIFTMLIFWLVAQLVLNIYYYLILEINVIRFFVASYVKWLLPTVCGILLAHHLSLDIEISYINFFYIGTVYSIAFVAIAWGWHYLLAKSTGANSYLEI